MEDIGYNWDLYYGRQIDGTVNFNAKLSEMEIIYKYMNDFAEKYKIYIDTRIGEQFLTPLRN